MRRLAFVFLAAIALFAFSNVAQARCGKERWPIKTGTDADSNLVDLTVHHVTKIATMRSWTAPYPIPKERRVTPYEFEVWQLDALLTDYKIENDPDTGDSDYHLVLKDKSGDTMIAEIPSPTCVDENSPFHAGVERARAQFDAKLHATGDFQDAELPVRVVGVGFFDFPHNQRGVAPNGIELHPVLDIVFNP